MALGEVSNGLLFKLTSFICWGNLYIYVVTALPEKSPEWCSRVVTLLHGSIATLVGYYQCGAFQKYVHASQFVARISSTQYLLMLWSWGYFGFDLLWCIIYWPDAYVMLCHHSFALAAITMYMYQDYTGCTFACTLVLMEVTNPLLQMRWFLKKEGYGETVLFLGVEVLYLTMFLFLRGILGTYVIYHIIKSKLFTTGNKIISLCLYIVSVAFIYDIIGYILYKYKREINIGYQEFTAFWQTNSLTFQDGRSNAC